MDSSSGAVGVEVAATTAEPQTTPAYTVSLRFTGTGSAYFRVWVVNLLLTLLTLGVYSPWAKVRKARWFAQHTELLGDRFDFHADPKRILLGRGVAVLLLALWTFAFDWSNAVGFGVAGLLCLVGPFLFANAQRFKLANTSWRGLRFGFDVAPQQSFVAVLPTVLLWVAFPVMQHLCIPGSWFNATVCACLLAMPWTHARLKHLQHTGARFGTQHFSFGRAVGAFYGLYVVAALAALGGLILMLPFIILFGFGNNKPSGANPSGLEILLGSVGVMLFIWVFAWPFLAARMQRVVWEHTRWGRIQFQGNMKSAVLWRLTWQQVLFTFLSGGLYWPFAAVALARYRVESITLQSESPLSDLIVQGPQAVAVQAGGDAVTDLFDLDLGW